MVDISYVLALIKISVFGINIPLALIYFLPLLLIHRFHNRLNMLTVNICLALMFLSVYIETMSTCQVPLAFGTLTINRFCAIVYSAKAFFKAKKFMVICIACQWIVGCFISLPIVIRNQPVKIFREKLTLGEI
jgi:hypothetical protein